MSRDCEHGQLTRSCNICDLARELKAALEQRDKLLAALIGPDFEYPDWSHKTVGEVLEKFK